MKSVLFLNRFTGQPVDKHWERISRLLTKADYHGSILTVVRSKCSSLVGKEGIVIIETKNTFQLVAQNNSLVGELYVFQ